MLRFVFTSLVFLAFGVNLAAAEPARIAVLELRNDADLKARETAYFTDIVREAAVQLPSNRFTVITRENILQMLPPDTTLADCEGDCEIETGRNIGADFIVTGGIIRLGESLKLSLQLYRVHSGRLLKTERATAKTVEALEGAVRERSALLFTPLIRVDATQSSSDEIRPSADTFEINREQAKALVRFKTTPPGAVVAVDGKPLCQTPCSKALAHGPHVIEFIKPEHLTSRVELVLTKSRTIARTLVLDKGSVTIKSDPTGQAIELSAVGETPRKVGYTPLKLTLAPGRYRVRVGASPCTKPHTKTIAITRGQNTAERFAPAIQYAGLKIELVDDAGHDREGVIFLNGRKMGSTLKSS